MKTNELIDLLVNDLRGHLALDNLLAKAFVVGTSIAAVIFFSKFGLRDDVVAALGTTRFSFKFVVTVALAATAFIVLRSICKPGLSVYPKKIILLLAPTLLCLAALMEAAVAPIDAWTALAIGHNSLKCLTIIPLLSVAPLASFLFVMRRGAPGKPGAAGVVAGLAAAGIAATFYAANCDDDSPLFVILWYPVAVTIVASVGYVFGSWLLRW